MQASPSAAAQIIVTIIPIVGIALGCTVLFFYLLYTHREKMLMIEKGLVRKSNFDIDLFSLFSGLLLTGIGSCLTIFFQLKEGVSYGTLSGIIPLACGVSLLAFYIIRLKTDKNKVK